ncbi:MAG: hypothetical protein KKF77_07190 [Proteobacteria bacterium]|nr:hypothetical protein [Pseudomonadota bacterium]
MDFSFIVGCCWFRQEDIAPLLTLLRQRPEIASDSRIGNIDIQWLDPGEFPMTAYDRVMRDCRKVCESSSLVSAAGAVP